MITLTRHLTEPQTLIILEIKMRVKGGLSVCALFLGVRHALSDVLQETIEAELAARGLLKQPLDAVIDSVIDSCNETTELVQTMATIRKTYGPMVRFFVYEKCGNPSPGRIRLWPGNSNHGHEFYTYARHVEKHYDNLANLVLFTSSRTPRPKRIKFLSVRANMGFECLRGHGTYESLQKWRHEPLFDPPKGCRGVDMSRCKGRPLTAADPRGVRKWAETYLHGYGDLNRTACMRGTFAATRESIRHRS